MSDFKKYRRTQIAEMMAWTECVDMSRVSVSLPDKEAGSPKHGDMIARNPDNHDDQWLVAKAYFEKNFEPIELGQLAEARKDVMTLTLRLLGEDNSTFSPECYEVMTRLRPKVMELLATAAQAPQSEPDAQE